MKKASASRMKKLPLLLGTLLIISVAAYGTRAYFSDSAKQQANIVLDLGNVKIKTAESEWNYTPSSDKNEIIKSVDDKSKVYTFKNVKPGDTFTRTYFIENTGSLDVKIGLKYSGSFSKNIELSDAIGPIEIPGTPFIASFSGLKKDFILEADNTEKNKANYTITITVNTDKKVNEFNNNSTNTDIKAAYDFINENIIVTADQI